MKKKKSARNNRVSRRDTVIYIVFTLLIALTLAFIFALSLKSPEASDLQSERFTEVFGGAMKFLFGERYDTVDVRKLAHFCEFALLGAEVATLFALTKKLKLQLVTNIAFFGMAAALTDECIQLFVGRDSSVRDILIDLSGYISGAGLVFVICCVVILIRNLRK